MLLRYIDIIWIVLCKIKPYRHDYSQVKSMLQDNVG